VQLLPREKKKQAYDAALVARYAHLPEVKRIARCVPLSRLCVCVLRLAHSVLTRALRRHRHVPKAIFKAGALRRTMEDSQRRKRGNVIKHSAPDSVVMKPARKERLVAVLQ
jgi:WD repeat and SOF domain-containing protein 1